jgi:phosphoribosyl-ATP pyrophosphohydrolase/phosphoribosyl-AMP cyclohydrolase
MIALDIEQLNFGKADGLICAVVQDVRTLQVLMVAWMDRAAVEETLASGEASFFSRSRQTRWRKGETSGNRLKISSITPDCDGDALLISVTPMGPACHRGTPSCFGSVDAPGVGRLGALERTIEARAQSPAEGSYTASLLAEGAKRAAQKLGEEGVETALAGAAGDARELCEESADLLYHLIVLLKSRGLSLDDVMAVLAARADANP